MRQTFESICESYITYLEKHFGAVVFDGYENNAKMIKSWLGFFSPFFFDWPIFIFSVCDTHFSYWLNIMPKYNRSVPYSYSCNLHYNSLHGHIDIMKTFICVQ